MRCCLDKGRCLNLRGTVYSEFHAAPLTSTEAFLLCWWWWWCYILHKTPPHADFFMLSALMAVSQWVGLTHKATLKERNSPLLLPLSLAVLSDQGCQTLKLDNWVKRKKKKPGHDPYGKGYRGHLHCSASHARIWRRQSAEGFRSAMWEWHKK